MHSLYNTILLDIKINIYVFIQHLVLVAQAMASLGHAPLGSDGGRGMRHTHCPAASNSGASRDKICYTSIVTGFPKISEIQTFSVCLW